MKICVHPNSMESYHTLPLTKRQQEVVAALKILIFATDEMVANHLGYTVNRVTGRLTELIKLGMVQEVGNTIGAFGRHVRVCRLVKKETLLGI